MVMSNAKSEVFAENAVLCGCAQPYRAFQSNFANCFAFRVCKLIKLVFISSMHVISEAKYETFKFISNSTQVM